MRLFKSNITTGGSGVSLYDLRQLAINEPKAFLQKVQAGADSGKLRFSDIRDLKAMYRFFADVKVPIQIEDIAGVKRAIDAAAFPILTGTLAIASINERYNSLPKVGQELVEEIEDNKKVTTIAAIEALDKNVDEVKSGDDFPEISATEEKVEIRHKLNGRKLTILADAIEENEVADITGRINALADIANDWVEEQTISRVTDYYGSATTPGEPYVYRPAGTGTQLYITTANYPGIRAPSGTRINSNALADDSDLDAVRAVLAAMKNNRGKRVGIPWSEILLFIPDALLGVASKIFNSEYVPGVENEVSNYGPRGRWSLPPARIVSSPKLDDLSTSAWYLGAFKRQFIRKWKLRFEYVTLGMDTQAYLNSRIAFQARIAWDVEVGARDYIYVVQSLSGTTAPYNV
ncbi:MAG: hypothetical protein ABIG61_02295 [Planctomycetota bacterium]